MSTDRSSARQTGDALIVDQAQSEVQTFFDELKNGAQHYRTIASHESTGRRGRFRPLRPLGRLPLMFDTLAVAQQLAAGVVVDRDQAEVIAKAFHTTAASTGNHVTSDQFLARPRRGAHRELPTSTPGSAG